MPTRIFHDGALLKLLYFQQFQRAIIVQHRFGAMPPEVDVALNKADIATSQRVLEALADTPSEAEVRTLLGL